MVFCAHIKGNRDYNPRPPETIDKQAAANAREELEMVQSKTKRHTAVRAQDLTPSIFLADVDGNAVHQRENAY